MSDLWQNNKCGTRNCVRHLAADADRKLAIFLAGDDQYRHVPDGAQEIVVIHAIQDDALELEVDRLGIITRDAVHINHELGVGLGCGFAGRNLS